MRERTNRRTLLKTGSAGLVGATAGCLSLLDSGGDGITVGGKEFTEQLILSYISYHLLDNAGYDVNDSSGLGGNTSNHEAIVQGETDHYWEYTGTGLEYHVGEEDAGIEDPDEQYAEVSQLYEEEFDIAWLDMAPFNNTYIVTANEEWQDETGVETLSELADYVNDENDVTWAVSNQYLENPTALGDLPEYYGFEETADDHVEWEEMSIGTINFQAVAEGEADLGVAFETDPQFQQFDIGTVEDDEDWFIIYYPAPLVREEILEEDDDIVDVLNAPTDALTTEAIQELNAEVAVDERDPSEVAREWLESEGLL